MTALLGIALWAIIPGAIARKKGRNFLVWYLISFLITPLISMIITICLKNNNTLSAASHEPAPSEPIQESSVTHAERELEPVAVVEVEESPKEKAEGNRFCRRCGTELIDNGAFCSNCGTPTEESIPT